MIIFVIMCMNILVGMEFDLFTPSFPQLQQHFQLSAFLVEALLSVNFIGYCLALFVVGHLGDRFGRRPIILTGLLIFVLGSVFCVSKDSFGFLLIGRLLQGIGIAAPSVLSFLIIADRYPLEKQQKWIATLNGVMNLAVGIAPVLGSYIVLHWQWQGSFNALLILGTAVLLLAWCFVPRDTAQHSLQPAWVGYASIFRCKPLLRLMSWLTLIFVPYWVFVGVSPLLYVKSFQVSLSHFGWYQGVLAFSFAIGCFLFGRIVKRLSMVQWLRANNWLFVVAGLIILWAVLSQSHSPLLITAGVLLYCTAEIVPSILFYPVCLNYLPAAKAKVAALMNAFRLLGAALMLEITGYFYNGTFFSTGLVMVLMIGAVVLWGFNNQFGQYASGSQLEEGE